MRAAVCYLFLLEVLCLSVQVQPQASDLWEAAVAWEGDLPCGGWDCECVFQRQVGCCCASEQLRQLEDRVFLRMTALYGSLVQLEDDIEQVTGDIMVAFSSSMSPNSECFGPYTNNMPIPYDVISLNYGNAYNSALGVFTAPSNGTYSFSFTAFSQMDELGRLYYSVRMMKNGQVVASAWEDNREDSEDSSTQIVLLPMQKGDQVYMELTAGRRLCGDVHGQNSFSGYLLYPTEAQG